MIECIPLPDNTPQVVTSQQQNIQSRPNALKTYLKAIPKGHNTNG